MTKTGRVFRPVFNFCLCPTYNIALLSTEKGDKMKLQDITAQTKNGKISHLGREMILYRLEIPQIKDESFPNSVFNDTAENYIKYLEGFAEKELVPELERLLEESKRLREIRRELGIPINAFLSWKFSVFNEKYLSARCETRLEYSNFKRFFTLKALTFDTESMTLKKASDFSKGAGRYKYSFYISSSKLYTFEKNGVFAENSDSAASLMGARIRKIDKIKAQNL